MRRYEMVLGLLVLGIGLGLLDARAAWADGDTGYKIVMSKDQHLCTRVREVLNEDLINYGLGYDPRKFAAPIFSAISWTPIKGLDEGFDYGGAMVRIDINNDGMSDVVVRLETSMGKDVSVHMLFIFKNDQYPELAKKRRELEDNAVGLVVPDLQKGYEFRKLPQKTFRGVPGLEGRKYYEGLSAYVFIHPFQFQNKTYVLLTQSPDSPAVPNWALVANYKQGKVREADPALMEDLCYLNLK